jgi:hypothetical protein
MHYGLQLAAELTVIELEHRINQSLRSTNVRLLTLPGEVEGANDDP